MQEGIIVRGGKSSWVTCAKDRPQQTVMLVFENSHQNNKITNKQKPAELKKAKYAHGKELFA